MGRFFRADDDGGILVSLGGTARQGALSLSVQPQKDHTMVSSVTYLAGRCVVGLQSSTKTVATVIMPTRSTVINAQSPIHQPPAAAVSLLQAGSWQLEQLLQRLAESDSRFLSLYCTVVWCWSSE